MYVNYRINIASPFRARYDVKTPNTHLYLASLNKEDAYVPNFPLAYLAGLFDGNGHTKTARYGTEPVIPCRKNSGLDGLAKTSLWRV